MSKVKIEKYTNEIEEKLKEIEGIISNQIKQMKKKWKVKIIVESDWDN